MKTAKPHTGYLISSVFIPLQEPTHYMVHQYLDPGVSGGIKMSKDDVIALVETSGMPVYVWLWNYEQGRFVIGKQVKCNVDYSGAKYLWINEKDPATKNLKHLIKIEWFQAAFTVK
nr:hypothetical protein [uncultured Flavobacterium sp.]